MKYKTIQPAFAVCGVAMLMLTATASASTLPPVWVGSMDYGDGNTSPSDVSGYEQDPGIVIGDYKTDDGTVFEYTNYVAFDIKSHITQFGNAPTSGDIINSDYELTLVATYDDEVTFNADGSVNTLDVISGAWEIWYSDTRNVETYYNTTPFDGEWKGFGDDGTTATRVIWGDITGGGNVSALSVELEATVEGYLYSVFDPDSLGFATGIFSFELAGVGNTPSDWGTSIADVGDLWASGAAVVSGANDSVARMVDGDVIFYTPIPAAVWLFGTAIAGFIGFTRRQALFGKQSTAEA